jgi:phosphatidylethanolamine N-methyltransferase
MPKASKAKAASVAEAAAPPVDGGEAAAKAPVPTLRVGELLGLNDDGSTFVVPRLPNTVETFVNPRQWNISTLLTLLFSAATIYVALSAESVLWAYSLSLVWRLMYNAFLGAILRVQSNSEGLTRLIARLEQSPALRKLLNARLSKAVAESTLTVRSWVHFRLIATTVLDLDVVAFLCVVYREFEASLPGRHCEPNSLE